MERLIQLKDRVPENHITLQVHGLGMAFSGIQTFSEHTYLLDTTIAHAKPSTMQCIEIICTSSATNNASPSSDARQPHPSTR